MPTPGFNPEAYMFGLAFDRPPRNRKSTIVGATPEGVESEFKQDQKAKPASKKAPAKGRKNAAAVKTPAPKAAKASGATSRKRAVKNEVSGRATKRAKTDATVPEALAVVTPDAALSPLAETGSATEPMTLPAATSVDREGLELSQHDGKNAVPLARSLGHPTAADEINEMHQQAEASRESAHLHLPAVPASNDDTLMSSPSSSPPQSLALNPSIPPEGVGLTIQGYDEIASGLEAEQIARGSEDDMIAQSACLPNGGPGSPLAGAGTAPAAEPIFREVTASQPTEAVPPTGAPNTGTPITAHADNDPLAESTTTPQLAPASPPRETDCDTTGIASMTDSREAQVSGPSPIFTEESAVDINAHVALNEPLTPKSTTAVPDGRNQLLAPPHTGNAGPGDHTPYMKRQRRPPKSFGGLIETPASLGSNSLDAEPCPLTPDSSQEADAEVREPEWTKDEAATSTSPPKRQRKSDLSKTTGGRAKKSQSQGALPKKTLTKAAEAALPAAKLKTPSTKRRPSTALVTLPSLGPLWHEVDVDQHRLKLAQILMRREALSNKPTPLGHPEVWAESRQALCETLSYFKKPQGGCYQNEGHVYGFLFDGLSHCREYLDSDVIICKSGGSMEPDPSGGMVQKKDQTFKEAQVQAVLNDIKHHNPVIVICGNRNTAAPIKMPHQYCVLGWYKPVMVWSEKSAGKGKKVWTTIKYRLERLNAHDPAWHKPADTRSTQAQALLADHIGDYGEQLCPSCQKSYPQVYLRGWVCLNAPCDKFWKFGGQEIPNDAVNMEYNPAFLLHRSPPWAESGGVTEHEPISVRPPVPEVGKFIGDNLVRINTRGVCCPKCGRCNQRRLFKGWVCETVGCQWELYPQHRPVLPAMLHTPWDAAPTLTRNAADPSVSVNVEIKYGYKISKYTFEGIDGCFIHAAATDKVLEEKSGPNDMFAGLQLEDIGLERRTFGVKKMAGPKPDVAVPVAVSEPDPAAPLPTPPDEVDTFEGADGSSASAGIKDAKPEFEDGDLMTAFSMNYGMPYKFVASGASRSFDDLRTPWPVSECRRRLNWAQKSFLDNKEGYEDLNELLILAYLEGQKIEYHDDGGEGLGPRIATLSLGGRAKMHMRMKMKHYAGCSKTGHFTEERPVPGGIGGQEMYQKRLRAWNELQLLKAKDSAAHTKRRKELPKELSLFETRMKKAPDLTTVTLSHGDIVIMEGYDIQKYLEHKVVPEGNLRFAMTCRTVQENHLEEHERPDYQVSVDPEVYHGLAV